jgi:hypothetical protein
MEKKRTELSVVVNSYNLYEELHFSMDGLLCRCWGM